MDDLTLLRSLRDDVAEPDTARLAPAYLKLETAMRSAEPARSARARGRHPVRWAAAGLTAAAAVAAAIVVGAVLAPPHPEAASAAAIVLRQTANEALAEPDPTPGPGQYLKWEIRSTSLGNITTAGDAGGTATRGPDHIGTADMYFPANLDDEWVQVFHSNISPGDEIRRGAGGSFFGGPAQAEEIKKLAKIPTGSGAETLAYFDARYKGGSASRDEDNFVRIADVLTSYPVSSALRARLFEALALIPGTTATPGVANFDGTVGVAIGRTEPTRSNTRTEIIIDPSTGRLIGMRQIYTTAERPKALPNDPAQLSLTAMSTTVVDSAP